MVVSTASSVPSLDVAQASDPGRDPRKQVNEDACGYRLTRHGHLLIVCDGMGGHAGGQQASQLAVVTIAQAVETAPLDRSQGSVLRDAIAQAGIAVFQLGGSQPPSLRPGSTCVALLVHSAGTEIAHVGDSRIYVIRGTQVWQLTRDHSVVQQMIDHGVCTPEEARRRPDANVITRALGMRPDVEVELRDAPFRHEAGDVFVLATDGLCDVVAPEELRTLVLGAPSLDSACGKLVELANARGGPDNITVMLARAHSPATSRTTERPGATQAQRLTETEIPSSARMGATIVQTTVVEPRSARNAQSAFGGALAPSATLIDSPSGPPGVAGVVLGAPGAPGAPGAASAPPANAAAALPGGAAASAFPAAGAPGGVGALGTGTLLEEPPNAAAFGVRAPSGPLGQSLPSPAVPPHAATQGAGVGVGVGVGAGANRAPAIGLQAAGSGASSWGADAHEHGMQAHRQQRKALVLLVLGFGLVLAILVGVVLWLIMAKEP